MSDNLPPLSPLPIKHDWHMWRNLNCCRQCGIVRNDKNGDALCRGQTKMRPFECPLTKGEWW